MAGNIPTKSVNITSPFGWELDGYIWRLSIVRMRLPHEDTKELCVRWSLPYHLSWTTFHLPSSRLHLSLNFTFGEAQTDSTTIIIFSDDSLQIIHYHKYNRRREQSIRMRNCYRLPVPGQNARCSGACHGLQPRLDSWGMPWVQKQRPSCCLRVRHGCGLSLLPVAGNRLG